MVWTAAYLQEVLLWEAQLEEVLVEEHEVSAELVEPPVLGEGAPEEVDVGVLAMNQTNLMEVTAVVEVILPVPVDAPTVVLEAEQVFLTPEGHTVADHWETLLAAALEVVRRLESEEGHLVELVEASEGVEEALRAVPEASVKV